MPANLENSAVAPGLEKINFYSNPKERQCQRILKLPHNCIISQASKVMPKFSKPGFNSMWTENFQMFRLDLEKVENQRSNYQHLLEYRKSKIIPEKHLLLLYWLCQSLWLCGSQQAVENSSRDRNTRPPGPWDICIQVKKQQSELDVEQQTDSK